MLSASGPIRKAGCVSMRLCAVREGGGGGGGLLSALGSIQKVRGVPYASDWTQ